MIRLFPSKRFEAFNIALPLVLAVPGIYEALGGIRLGRDELIFGKLLANNLFLNYLHVYLTLAMLWTVPELKSWIRETTKGRPSRFWAPVLSIILLTYLVFYLLRQRPFEIHELILLGMVILVFATPGHHTIAQVHGLSLVYQKRIEALGLSGPSESPRERTSARLERLSFHGLIGFYCTYQVQLALGFTQGRGPPTGSFATAVHVGIAFFAFAAFVAGCAQRGAWKSTKPLYLARLLVFPLVPFSNFAYFGVAALHGVEYLGVYGLMTSQSKIEPEKRRRLHWIAGSLVFVGMLMQLTRFQEGLGEIFYSSEGEVPLALKVIALGALGTIYIHYYLDRILFRMRNPITRRWIAPLLAPRARSQRLQGGV